MTTEPADPATLLRRVIAAYDAFQAARAGAGPALQTVEAATTALGAAVEAARQGLRAHERWRREESARGRR